VSEKLQDPRNFRIRKLQRRRGVHLFALISTLRDRAETFNKSNLHGKPFSCWERVSRERIHKSKEEMTRELRHFEGSHSQATLLVRELVLPMVLRWKVDNLSTYAGPCSESQDRGVSNIHLSGDTYPRE
jgi:hypothetical protein